MGCGGNTPGRRHPLQGTRYVKEAQEVTKKGTTFVMDAMHTLAGVEYSGCGGGDSVSFPGVCVLG